VSRAGFVSGPLGREWGPQLSGTAVMCTTRCVTTNHGCPWALALALALLAEHRLLPPLCTDTKIRRHADTNLIHHSAATPTDDGQRTSVVWFPRHCLTGVSWFFLIAAGWDEGHGCTRCRM